MGDKREGSIIKIRPNDVYNRLRLHSALSKSLLLD